MDVHANSDDEEIFFFSNEFDADKSINGSENFKLFVDEKEKPFKTSMKLKAGEHKMQFYSIIPFFHAKICLEIAKI